MKAAHGLLMALLLAAGCLPMQTTLPEAPPKPDISERPGTPRNLVAADQVDERNARDKAKTLEQELQMDAQDAAKTSVTASKK